MSYFTIQQESKNELTCRKTFEHTGTEFLLGSPSSGIRYAKFPQLSYSDCFEEVPHLQQV